MCGFVGYLSSSTEYDRLSVVTEMADIIAHRGPDSDGYFVDEVAALGFRRLAIIDVEQGDQPLLNEDGSMVLCFNGEIYNHDQLREELAARGHVFKTKADSEVVLHGFEEWGEDVLGRLRGMFAFVLYDVKSAGLFAARDPFGIKPFYYYRREGNEGGGSLLFASEAKAFLAHPEFEKRFNEARLPHYLCFEYLPDEETFFEGVFRLPAGHFMRCDFPLGDSLTIERYFQVSYEPDAAPTRESWTKEIALSLRESCQAHSIADVEVGCFLSAGVDSSYVSYEASRIMAAKTFSIGYEEEKYSELGAARDLAQAISVENLSTTISAQDFFDAVPSVQYHMDEPLPNPSAIPLFYLAQFASREVKVVLSGEGADELFGGYSYYQECLPFERYMKLPAGLRSALAALVSRLPAFHGRRFIMRGKHELPVRYIRNNYVFSHDEWPLYLRKDYGAAPPEDCTAGVFAKSKGLDEVTRMQLADIEVWMQYDILQKADKMSMAHSLELRVPFLDKQVLEVARRLPTKDRVSRETTKLALRDAARRELPEKTASMPKIGFITPLNDWLKQEEFTRRIREAFRGPIAREFFVVENLERLLDDHVSGKRPGMKKIWSIYCFIVWYEEFFVKR